MSLPGLGSSDSSVRLKVCHSQFKASRTLPAGTGTSEFLTSHPSSPDSWSDLLVCGNVIVKGSSYGLAQRNFWDQYHEQVVSEKWLSIIHRLCALRKTCSPSRAVKTLIEKRFRCHGHFFYTLYPTADTVFRPDSDHCATLKGYHYCNSVWTALRHDPGCTL